MTDKEYETVYEKMLFQAKRRYAPFIMQSTGLDFKYRRVVEH